MSYVNGDRVEHRDLADGDRINLGPVAVVPLTFRFRPLGAGPPADATVYFEDSACGPTVNLTIDVEQFERRRERTPPPAAVVAGTLEAPTHTSIASLFRQVGEVLLLSRDLDAMLGDLVGLALENLDAQRGAICLCDEPGGPVVPRTIRARRLAGEPSIRVSRSIARAAVEARQAVLVADVVGDARFAHAESIQQMRIVSAMCAPLYHAGQVLGLIYVDTLDPARRFDARDLELLAALGGLTAVGIERARLRDDVERERALRERLARYLAPGVVECTAVRASLHDGEMLSEEREVSVLFGDICGFTPLAETMPPAEVAALLNGAFEQLHHAIFLYEGTLDKYLGDAVMAVFGAPLDQADHAERAVSAARRMQELLDDYNRRRPGATPLRMRIGINSGRAVAGDIGSPARREYTVIGDVVNVAARLEATVAQPGQIVVGPQTRELVREKFECRPLPEVCLKGRQHPIRPYLVVGRCAAAAPIEETVYRGSILTGDDGPRRT